MQGPSGTYLNTNNLKIHFSFMLNDMLSLLDICAEEQKPKSRPKSSRRKNPARAKRSRLRLEKFNQQKEEEKLIRQDIGSQVPADVEATSKQLIIELDTQRDQVVGTSLPSPMVQLDGAMEEGKVKYTFLSDYAEEDIKYTLD